MEDVGDDYPILRSAQQSVSEKVENVYLCSISDLGEQYDIHPKNKKDVGIRLALLALKYLYGKPILADAPKFTSAKKSGNEIRLLFEHAGSSLQVNGGHINALTVAIHGNPVHYDYRIHENEVILSIPNAAKNEVQISFARTKWYQVNLKNEAGLPAIPFEITVMPE